MKNTKSRLTRTLHKVERLAKTVELSFPRKQSMRESEAHKSRFPRLTSDGKPLISKFEIAAFEKRHVVHAEPQKIHPKFCDPRMNHYKRQSQFLEKTTYGVELLAPLTVADIKLVSETHNLLYYLKTLCISGSQQYDKSHRDLYHKVRRFLSISRVFSSSHIIPRVLGVCGTDLRLSMKDARKGNPSGRRSTHP